MSETNKKPAQRPLPRFQPLANKKSIGDSSKVRSIPISASMPSFQPFQQKPRTPKKQRAPQFMDFGDVRNTGNRRTFNSNVPDFYTPISKAIPDDGELISDSARDVKLPLVKPEEQTKPITDILLNEQPKFVLVQIPSALPIKYPNDSGQMEGNPLVGATDGHLGKIQIHKSGKVTAVIGNNHFDLLSGTFASCSQILCNESATGGLDWFTLNGEKIILTLDVDKMLEQIDQENQSI